MAAGSGAGISLGEALAVLRRWWWLVVGLPALVLALSLATFREPPPIYQARLTFAVDIPRSAIVEGSDEGTAAKIGEALIDDLSRMIGGDVFADAVAEHVPAHVEVRPGEIASSLSATDRHRIADVTVTRQAPPEASAAQLAELEGELLAVARAVVTELDTNGNEWFARLGEDRVRLTITDRPKAHVLPRPLRTRLEIPLRTLLALAVGVGLALMLSTLDPRLHTDAAAEASAGAPVLGRIPHRRRWSSHRRMRT